MSIIYKILGIAAALFAALFGARQWGRESVKREQAEKTVNDMRTSNEIEDRNRSATDSDVAERLRKYRRD